MYFLQDVYCIPDALGPSMGRGVIHLATAKFRSQMGRTSALAGYQDAQTQLHFEVTLFPF